MKNIDKTRNSISRRKFLGSTAAAAALTMVPLSYGCTSKTPAAGSSVPDKPNSKFGGVQIGAITYSWRSMPGGVENIIKYCKESGISSIELMSGDLEQYLGAPKNPMAGMFGPGAGGPRPAGPACWCSSSTTSSSPCRYCSRRCFCCRCSSCRCSDGWFSASAINS